MGQESIKLYLEFLKRNNKTDSLILKNTKVSQINNVPLTVLMLPVGCSRSAFFNLPHGIDTAKCVYECGHYI